MSENIFDDESMAFVVLINHEKQYSLWPEVLTIPSGWDQVFGPQTRDTCLSWLNANWTDLRPKSLIEMDGN
ncbi:antibiotic synthesis protein MbtH [Pseudoalteromonas porphyrae]|uniref:Antibiotic synthesis protein MbtH n=1 Tax=Pseudoalteromonas porphyrae TaxID=187330 RepID=A0A0N1EQ90_9GAMM|nr:MULTISPECIES: MbtH family NRPS accessory protein [Pseudoalteromonas]KPH65597.1 antibiotic synthesis protein MbtH [Pseudoalteromonas porphyrae]KPH95585.1 antibiotic synthesis protein MbtH [Pseudoalteromonas porphyrae]